MNEAEDSRHSPSIEAPQGALSWAQEERIVHCITDLLVEYFADAART